MIHITIGLCSECVVHSNSVVDYFVSVYLQIFSGLVLNIVW